MADFYGTAGNDTRRGTEENDSFEGRGGSDRLYGEGGYDHLYGEDGDDFLFGGTEYDRLFGGQGNDYLNGEDGGDQLWGDEGDDRLIGGLGGDDLYGGDGHDFLSGGDDYDEIWGGDGNDRVSGGEGSDLLSGAAGNDEISGETGQDQLLGGDGDDVLTGGSGSDYMKGGKGLDRFVGGTHDGVDLTGVGLVGDRISFFEATATQGVVADLRSGVIENDGYGNLETMVGIESLSGDTAFADAYFGSDVSNYLSAAIGDTAMGFGGDDFFQVGAAPALVDGGSGIDIVLGFYAEVLAPDSDGDGAAETIVAPGGISVDLALEQVQDSFGNTGTIRGIEHFGGSLSAADDVLRGDDHDNIIRGHGGADIIDGRGGSDTISYSDLGFIEHYTYHEGHGAVEVDLAAGYSEESDLKRGMLGADTPRYGRDALTGIENIIGSGLGDRLLGDSGDNVIAPGAGNDMVDGRGGMDTVDYSSARGALSVDLATGVALQEGSGAQPRLFIGPGPDGQLMNIYVEADDAKESRDRLFNIENVIGSAFNDDITGSAAANVLDGGAGDDRLAGLAGDDVYLVGSAGDVVVEAANEGTDVVRASVHYTLTAGSHVERLEASGTTALGLTGNALANEIVGNGAANILNGAGGNDRLVGGADGDTLLGGLGNDRLDGGSGIDAMRGEAGHDTYVVTEGDRIVELAGGGSDTVLAGFTYRLGSEVEVLTLTGTGNFAGTGNGGDNTLSGNGGDNTLKGMGGNDLLRGGLGNDLLMGNAGADDLAGQGGADRFWFTAGDTGVTEAAADHILDFQRGQDKVVLTSMDADTTATGNSAFRFIGAGAFTGDAGELRFEAIAGGGVRVEGDLNGDSLADFAIYVDRLATVTASDFLL